MTSTELLHPCAGAAPPFETGFTYIGLLLAVAIMAVGSAAAGQVWHTTVQREKEMELQFIGGEFKQAIERYYESTPGPVKQLPPALTDLLRDPRHPTVVRHLRRMYRDPVTEGEWGLVKQDGRIVGVYSVSDKTPMRNGALADGTTKAKYSDWKFVAELTLPAGGAITAAPPASSPQTPAPVEPVPTAPETVPAPAPEPRPKSATDRD
ncbi:MAG TPA: type II secretion system protein [Burkholderiales bacterium]|nr:type II secretion system protein [Burkholderiales bacterium]